MTNALDAFAQDKTGRQDKKVTLRTKKPRGWGAEYQVVDNGCGMSPEIKKNIFKGFFSTKGSDGTGIGLMITQKIVKEHMGVIEVESEEGVGSKFIIKIPEMPKRNDC